MNPFDHIILIHLNQVIRNSPIVTKMIVAIYGNGLMTGIFVALLWGVWFDQSNTERQRQTREKIIAGVVGSLVCLVIVRMMTAFLPFRHRPLTDPSNGLIFPVTSGGWEHWSSFPSDNAALFFLLTICLFSTSRVMGWIGLLDTVCLICFPRVFVGVHYPTDVIGGAVLGMLAGYIVIRKSIRSYLARYPLQWMEVHPPSFYASAFLVTFLFASVFWPVLSLLISLKKLLYFESRLPLVYSLSGLAIFVAVLALVGLWGRMYWEKAQNHHPDHSLQ